MEPNRAQRIYRIIMLMIITVLITFISTSIFMRKQMGTTRSTKYIVVPNSESGIDAQLTQFHSIIDEYYYGDVDNNKLKEGALKGYILGLEDKYSAYISKDEYADFQTDILGNFVGIGIYMSTLKDTDEIVVVSPIKNSPAEKAGIKSGDIINKVNGESFIGRDGLQEASNKIKGELGTLVNLEIKRNEEILTFEIKREKVILNPIESEKLENNVGYIQVTSFDEDTSIEFKKKFEELKSQGIQSLIIDLRNNGGGIVEEAIKIADYIVPKDKILMITENKKEKQTTEKAVADPIINMPVVALVNENSASASEILVGALKDNGCATIVGTTTYGKGVIQEVLKLSDGSALKLTTEEYFTPNHNKINKTGVTPDEVVNLPSDVLPSYSIEREKDTQLKKAIEILSRR